MKGVIKISNDFFLFCYPCVPSCSRAKLLLFSAQMSPKVSCLFLFSSAAKGHKGCVELLLNNNASLNGKDKVRIILTFSCLVHNVMCRFMHLKDCKHFPKGSHGQHFYMYTTEFVDSKEFFHHWCTWITCDDSSCVKQWVFSSYQFEIFFPINSR